MALSSSVINLDALASLARSTGLPGRWYAERDPASRQTRLGFRCGAGGHVLISDTSIEGYNAATPVVRDEAERLFHGTHQARVRHADLMIACPACQLVSPFPDESQLDLGQRFERAEQQATRWMERAQSLALELRRQ